MKENIGIFSDFLCVSFCSSTKSRKFSKNLKLPDIKPLHKKGKKVSILPNLSKICKKCIFTQMLQSFNNIFSKYQCGFRKSTAAVDSENLLTMEKLLVLYWRIYRRLLIALIVNYINYLSNRKQRTKIHPIVAGTILFWGVPQGSILGSLLFNNFLIDLFFIIEELLLVMQMTTHHTWMQITWMELLNP